MSERGKPSRREFLWQAPLAGIGLAKIASQIIPAFLRSFKKRSIDILQQQELLVPPEDDQYANTVILGSSSIREAIDLISGEGCQTGEFTQDEVLTDHTYEYTKNSSNHKYILDGWSGKNADDMTTWFDNNPDLHVHPNHIVLALGFNDVFDLTLTDSDIINCAKRVVKYANKMKTDHDYATVDLVLPFPTYSFNENDRLARATRLQLFKNTVYTELHPGDIINDTINVKDPIFLVQNGQGQIDPSVYIEGDGEDKRHLCESRIIRFLRYLLK